jgi:hypothetical protein
LQHPPSHDPESRRATAVLWIMAAGNTGRFSW